VPFQYIMANLLAETSAVGVLFLDETGETVDVACSDYTPHEMKVLGAYLGIYLRHIGEMMREIEMGLPAMIHIERKKLHIFAIPLPEEYYLVLVQRPPAVIAFARRNLEVAARELAAELFD